MRLSDHNTDSAADVLITIAPLIDNIMQDTAVSEQINAGITAVGGGTAGVIAGLTSKILKILPVLLGKDTHRADLFGILAAINKTTAEKIGKQLLPTTLKQIREAINDEELVDFFQSFVPVESNGQSAQSVTPQN